MLSGVSHVTRSFTFVRFTRGRSRRCDTTEAISLRPKEFWKRNSFAKETNYGHSPEFSAKPVFSGS